MKLFSIVLLSTITFVIKAQCLSTNSSDYLVKWQAFKTYNKIGVAGEFKDIELKNITPNLKFDTGLKALNFTINTFSVTTENEARDTNLREYFFDFKKIDIILEKVEKKFITIKVTINNKSKKIPLKYEVKDNTIFATGYFDMLDFGLSKQLSALNKQCFALHEGKTWSDVEIFLQTKLASCK